MREVTLNIGEMLSVLSEALDGSNPATDALIAADHLRKAVGKRAFKDDCLMRGLINVFQAKKERPSQDLYCNPKTGLRARLFFWPPGFETPPHQHSAWTCSAVLVNVVGFRRHKSLPDDQSEIVDYFLGREGDVGRMIPPSVHSVCNPSGLPSASISIFGSPVAGFTHDEGDDIYGNGLVDRAFWCATDALSRSGDLESARRLYKVFGSAHFKYKLRLAVQIAKLDPKVATDCLAELQKEAPDGIDNRIAEFHRRFAVHTGTAHI
jgi:predicted metal-dependent enzyme (double-stranded beta helix superfamily)